MAVLPLRDDDPTRIGPYDLDGRLRADLTGTVFLGRARDGLPATVTVLHDDGTDDADTERSARERVDIARRAGDAWGITVLDTDATEDAAWIATSFLDGPTLADVVHDEGPLTARAARELAATAAERLGSVHARGFAHDRLEPSDLVVTADGPRLAHLGLVRAHGPNTAADDVRALGATLHFACVGHSSSPAADPATLSDVPDDLAGLISACLATDPADRPTTTEIIARTGDDTPRTAVLPGTRPDRETRATRMSLRAAVAWMVGGAVGAVAVIGAGLVVLETIETDRREARAAARQAAEDSPASSGPERAAGQAHEVTFELDGAGPDVGKAPVTLRYRGWLGGEDQVDSIDLGDLGDIDVSDDPDPGDVMTSVDLPWSTTVTLHGTVDGTGPEAATPALQISGTLNPYDEDTGSYLPSDVALTCRILIDGEVVTEHRSRTTNATCNFYDNTEQQARHEARQAEADAGAEKLEELMERMRQADDPDDLARLSEQLREIQDGYGTPGDSTTPPGS